MVIFIEFRFVINSLGNFLGNFFYFINFIMIILKLKKGFTQIVLRNIFNFLSCKEKRNVYFASLILCF